MNMKFPSIFKNRSTKAKRTSWEWRPQTLIKHLKALSFYAKGKLKFKKGNHSALTDVPKSDALLDDSLWSQSNHFSEKLIENSSRGDHFMKISVYAVNSKRLTFDHSSNRSSQFILIDRAAEVPLQDCEVESFETEDPYVDFRDSIEEMVEAYGWKSNEEKDLEYLEGLFGWYLRKNSKKNHGFIIEAFVDMFVARIAVSCSSGSYPYGSLLLHL